MLGPALCFTRAPRLAFRVLLDVRLCAAGPCQNVRGPCCEIPAPMKKDRAFVHSLQQQVHVVKLPPAVEMRAYLEGL